MLHTETPGRSQWGQSHHIHCIWHQSLVHTLAATIINSSPPALPNCPRIGSPRRMPLCQASCSHTRTLCTLTQTHSRTPARAHTHTHTSCTYTPCVHRLQLFLNSSRRIILLYIFQSMNNICKPGRPAVVLLLQKPKVCKALPQAACSFYH